MTVAQEQHWLAVWRRRLAWELASNPTHDRLVRAAAYFVGMPS